MIVAQTSVFINLWTSMITDETSEDKMEMAINTFMPFGFGSIIGPFIIGPVQDRYGYKATMSLIFVQNLMFMPWIIVYNEIHQFTWMAYIIMFF
jgi:MFS family permease